MPPRPTNLRETRQAAARVRPPLAGIASCVNKETAHLFPDRIALLSHLQHRPKPIRYQSKIDFFVDIRSCDAPLVTDI